MPIGNRQAVRNLTGITDETDLTNTDIDAALLAGKGEIYAVTFKTDWDTSQSHPLYTKAEMLVHYVASYNILDRYAGNLEKANTHRERARELATELKAQYDQYTLVNSSNDPSTSKFGVVASKYKTYPLNLDATIPRSTVIIPGD